MRTPSPLGGEGRDEGSPSPYPLPSRERVYSVASEPEASPKFQGNVGGRNIRVLTRGIMDKANHLDRVVCAFCKGIGKDPFGIMSPEAVCQVCNGTGAHIIVKPHIACAYCHGSGVEFGTRNTCLSCGGKGQISMNKQHALCDLCHGSGMETEAGLRCDKCGGAGVIEVKTQI